MKKRGQFYLIGAIIIAIIMFATFSLTNRSSKQGYATVYDLGEELDLEQMYLQEYGIAVDENELEKTFDDFLKNYSVYITDPDTDIFFFYGKEEQAVGNPTIKLIVSRANKNAFTIGETRTRGAPSTLSEQKVTVIEGRDEDAKEGQGKGQVVRMEYSGKSGTETIDIPINDGEYFYYILVQKIGQEQHVVTSEK
jgi:hypothetical protein